MLIKQVEASPNCPMFLEFVQNYSTLLEAVFVLDC